MTSCRVSLDEKDRQKISELLKAHLDWDFIIYKARKEDISPLLYYHLSKIRNAVYLLQLRNDYYNTTAYNLVINQEFFNILHNLKESDVPAIPLKGIALIQAIYPVIGLRRMGDIDILIKREDLITAGRILEKLGYSCIRNNYLPIKSYSPYLNSLFYRKTGTHSISIHIHWHLINTTLPLLSVYKINMEELWENAETEYCGGRDILMLSPHHLLLYLSMHTLHHYFERLILLCDIQEAIRFYGDRLHWDMLIRTAQTYNISRPLYYSLYLGTKLLGFSLPPNILIRLRPDDISYGERRLVSSILKFDNKAYNSSYPVYLSMAGKFLKKIKFIWLSLFPPRYYLCQIKQIKPEDITIMHYLKRLIQGLRLVIGEGSVLFSSFNSIFKAQYAYRQKNT